MVVDVEVAVKDIQASLTFACKQVPGLTVLLKEVGLFAVTSLHIVIGDAAANAQVLYAVADTLVVTLVPNITRTTDKQL